MIMGWVCVRVGRGGACARAGVQRSAPPRASLDQGARSCAICESGNRTQPRPGVAPGDPQHEAEGWTWCPRGGESSVAMQRLAEQQSAGRWWWRRWKWKPGHRRSWWRRRRRRWKVVANGRRCWVSGGAGDVSSGDDSGGVGGGDGGSRGTGGQGGQGVGGGGEGASSAMEHSARHASDPLLRGVKLGGAA